MSTTTKSETDCGKRVHHWKPYEIEHLLEMHRDGKNPKEMLEDFWYRSEGAISQKLSKLLTCRVCRTKFDTEKKLKIHISRKQDDKHKTFKEKKKPKSDKVKEKKKTQKKANIKSNDKNTTNTNNIQQEEPAKKKDAKEKKKDKEKKKESKKINPKSDKGKEKKKKQKKANAKSNDKNTTNTNIINIHNTIGIQQQEVQIREPPKKKQRRNPPEDWSHCTVDEVADWVQGLGAAYTQYVDKFKAEGIDGAFMSDLENRELLEEIVTSPLRRKVLFENWGRL